jgi:hypothetical protein
MVELRAPSRAVRACAMQRTRVMHHAFASQPKPPGESPPGPVPPTKPDELPETPTPQVPEPKRYPIHPPIPEQPIHPPTPIEPTTSGGGSS